MKVSTATLGMPFDSHINQGAETKTSSLSFSSQSWVQSPQVQMLRTVGSFALRVIPLHWKISRVVWIAAMDLNWRSYPRQKNQVERLEALKRRFPGIKLSTSMEPSHGFIDKVIHQYEENCVERVCLSTRTARKQEIESGRSTSELSFDAHGNIKSSRTKCCHWMFGQWGDQIAGCSHQKEFGRWLGQHCIVWYDGVMVAAFIWSDLPGTTHGIPSHFDTSDHSWWSQAVDKSSRDRKIESCRNNRKGGKNVEIDLRKLAHHQDVKFHMLPLPLVESSSASPFN